MNGLAGLGSSRSYQRSGISFQANDVDSFRREFVIAYKGDDGQDVVEHGWQTRYG